MKKLLLAVCLLSANVQAKTIVQDATIVKLGVYKSYGNFAWIKLSKDPSRPEDNGCATDLSWHFTLPLNTEQDKVMYSTLLAAFHAKTPLRIDGYSAGITCSEYPAVESMDGFTFE